MSDEFEFINFFDTDACNDMIADEMDIIDDLKNRIPKEQDKDNTNLVDKLFFKRVLKDITSMSLINEELKVYFHRGVPLHLDGADIGTSSYAERTGNVFYRICRVIKELVDLGEIKIRTSPFVVSLTMHNLQATYFQSLDDEFFEFPIVKNAHDAGLNCWGG